MAENYTKPNDPDHADKPQDWLFGALLFSKGLRFLIPKDYGIVIDLVGDMIKLYPNAKRVIVANKENQIVVIDADDRPELIEGDWVQIIKLEEN